MSTSELVRRLFEASGAVTRESKSQPPPTSKRVTWKELAAAPAFAGKWVALDRCRYDAATRELLEGDFVDSDVDAAELCGRLRDAGRGACAIRFCSGQERITLAPPAVHA